MTYRLINIANKMQKEVMNAMTKKKEPKKEAKATPKKRSASKKKELKKPNIGGLQVSICTRCKREIKPGESYEVLPDGRRHRPMCEL